MEVVPICLAAPLLIAVGYYDLRYMRIPNAISLIAIALFLVMLPLFPPSDLAVRLVAAALVFTLGFTAFAFGMIGAGDVKILSALLLFVPPVHMAIFANVFSASMLVGIVLVLSLRRFPVSGQWGWKSFSGTTKFPMGLSIAMTGLAFPLVTLSMHH